ncbi:MAG: hypothetical protein P8P20_11695 [Acidimicrobiales bacterium]|nr:hypothetical protein [Acidimicrobiales bacterium]
MSITPSEAPATGTSTPDDGWKAAGSAWGHAAADWAYLWEPSIRVAADHIFDRVGLGPGTDLLDVACYYISDAGRTAYERQRSEASK